MFCPDHNDEFVETNLLRDEIGFVNRTLDKTNLGTARTDRRRHLIRIANRQFDINIWVRRVKLHNAFGQPIGSGGLAGMKVYYSAAKSSQFEQ